MSEPYLSTRSMTCMHLKKFKVFSSLRRPETHFGHARGHQQACALTGSTNIFQSTFNTAYEVVHQKTVNTNLGKDYVAFRSNQSVLPLLPRKISWKIQKERKKSYIAILKLINRHYKILRQKSTSFFKQQTRIPLKQNIEKI